MIRLWIVVATTLLGSCSLSREPGGSTLATLWSVTSPTADLPIAADQLAITNDLVVTTRGRTNDIRQLVSYERVDGSTRWQQGVGGVCSPPIFESGRIYCPAADLYAFDAETGRPIWVTDVPDRLDQIQGTADASRVYAGTSDFNGQTTEAFAANAATGQIVWRRGFTGDGWLGARLRSLTLSPEGDLIAAVVALLPPAPLVNTAAVFVALDPATGAERWRVQIGQSGDYRDASGLTFFENLMLYNDRYGTEVVAIDRTTREVVWRAPWTPTYLGTLRAPQVKDGVVYFSDSAGVTFAVDARTGWQIWSTDLDGGAYSLEVCGPVVLMNNGPVEVLDRATGRSRGRLLADDDRAGQMAVADDVLYVSAASGVYAFDCTS